MKRNPIFVGLAVAGALTLVGCSQSSPTAPKQPTPTALGISLTVSPSVVGINESITAVALVTTGSGSVPDGTKVTFTASGSASFSATGTVQQAFVTTTSGGAAVAVYASAPGDFLITASIPSKSDSKPVHFRGVATSQLAVTSVLPNRGKPQGGDPVTVNGQGFKQPVAVNFVIGATSYAATVLSVAPDGSSISATTPQVPATAGDQAAAVQVTLTGIAAPGGGYLSATLASAFTYGADTGTPQLNSVVPASGLASGGEVLSLTGRYLTEPLQVSFVFPGMTVPGVVGSVQHGADGFDIAHVTTPKVTIAASTMVNVTITNGVGTATSKTATFNQVFTFLLSPGGPPTIFYVAPTFGTVQGHETVLIYGQNFTPSATVSIGPTPEAVVHVAEDGTMIQAMTNPVGGPAPTGPQDVTVTTTAGTFTLSQAFTYLEGATPQLFALSPNLGPTEGGTRVTITGAGFQYPVQVLFGALQAQVVTTNFNQVVCISPSITPQQPGTPVTVGVTVTNTSSGKQSNSLQFQYGQAMFISSIAPAGGPDTGGTSVTIFGQGFTAPVAVSFAGTAAASIQTVSGTEVVATTGGVLVRSCSPITGPVSVTNIDSNITATGSTWTYTPMNPLITGATSNCATGASTGCTITITGNNFEPSMRIIFTNPPLTLPAIFDNVNQIHANVTTSFEAAGITYRTVPCTGGTQKVATAIDVKVLNTSNKCEDTLPGGLTITPSDTSCVTPPVAPVLTIAPPATTVSAAAVATSSQTITFTVTVTGTTFPATININYGGTLAFSPPPQATVTTDGTGVGTFPVTVPAGATNGLTATVTVSFGTAVPKVATVTIGP